MQCPKGYHRMGTRASLQLCRMSSASRYIKELRFVAIPGSQHAPRLRMFTQIAAHAITPATHLVNLVLQTSLLSHGSSAFRQILPANLSNLRNLQLDYAPSRLHFEQCKTVEGILRGASSLRYLTLGIERDFFREDPNTSHFSALLRYTTKTVQGLELRISQQPHDDLQTGLAENLLRLQHIRSLEITLSCFNTIDVSPYLPSSLQYLSLTCSPSAIRMLLHRLAQSAYLPELAEPPKLRYVGEELDETVVTCLSVDKAIKGMKSRMNTKRNTPQMLELYRLIREPPQA